jgi:hypothetical protein
MIRRLPSSIRTTGHQIRGGSARAAGEGLAAIGPITCQHREAFVRRRRDHQLAALYMLQRGSTGSIHALSVVS